MKFLTRTLAPLLLVLLSFGAHSQNLDEQTASDPATQLNVVQSFLDAKLIERNAIRAKIAGASPSEVSEIEIELKEINAEIVELRQSFEQIAVGSVDLGVFNDDNGEFDWRNEVTQVMLPIIRNLQSLTEKPRKLEALKTQIAANTEQIEIAKEALTAIESNSLLAVDEPTKQTLSSLEATWREQLQETERTKEVAQVKLKNLQKNNTNFFQSLKTAFYNFFTGRGLTIAIAIAAAALVWYTAKLFSRLLLKKSRAVAADTYRTRQRLIHYGFNLLTGLLMTIAAIVVFYVRSDVLLLGLTLLLLGGAILGLRNTIPKFISEARLLLNLGSIRENERVVYNGLPYRVASLNMYSVLKNPELTGVIRLPLDSLDNMISRPSGKESWFPASKGEYILLSDGKLLEVIELTTELVHLQNLAGTKTTIPTADFYNMTFDNLSRGDSFSIISTFGIGYSHQSMSNKAIPDIFETAIKAAFDSKDYGEHIESVSVELKEAGASSLDYWICVTVARAGIRSYFKVNRVVQQTCVDTCTAENWDIPFPQLTIHNQS